jgi:chromatin remodeling complex protein RSC6
MAGKNSAFMKPRNLSPELEAVIGKGPMPFTDVMKKVWAYIKSHNLQNPENKRNILADDKLKAVFGGKSEVTMFEMTTHLNNHAKMA